MKTVLEDVVERRLIRLSKENSRRFEAAVHEEKDVKNLLQHAVYQDSIPTTSLRRAVIQLYSEDKGWMEFEQVYDAEDNPVFSRPYSRMHYLGQLHGMHVAHVVDFSEDTDTGISAVVNETGETLFNGWWDDRWLQVQLVNSSQPEPVRLQLWEAYITAPGKPRLHGDEDLMLAREREGKTSYLLAMSPEGERLLTVPQVIQGPSRHPLSAAQEARNAEWVRFTEIAGKRFMEVAYNGFEQPHAYHLDGTNTPL